MLIDLRYSNCRVSNFIFYEGPGRMAVNDADSKALNVKHRLQALLESIALP